MEKLEFGNLDHLAKAKEYQRQADIEDAKDHLSDMLCAVDTTREQDAIVDALNGNDVLNDEVDGILEDLDRLHGRITDLQTANP